MLCTRGKQELFALAVQGLARNLPSWLTRVLLLTFFYTFSRNAGVHSSIESQKIMIFSMKKVTNILYIKLACKIL
jgi:hypothetical protein